MLELLPNANKKAVKKEYFLRLTIVALSFLIATEIFFLVSLLPSYFLSAVKERVVYKEFESVIKSNNSSEEKELRTTIKETKEMVASLKPKGDTFLMKDLIFKIIGRKNSGIKIIREWVTTIICLLKFSQNQLRKLNKPLSKSQFK